MKLFIDTGSGRRGRGDRGLGRALRAPPPTRACSPRRTATRATSSAGSATWSTGPTSAEVVATDAEGMITEGRALAGLHHHVVVKVPFSPAGLQATRELTSEGIRVNMTLVFSRRPGHPHRRGGRHLRLVLHGPRGRHRGRRHGGARRDRRRPARQRGPGAGGLAAPPDARGHRRHARLRRGDHPRPRCSSRCSCTRSPTAGIDKFAADWQSDPRFAEWLSGLVEGARRPRLSRVRPPVPIRGAVPSVSTSAQGARGEPPRRPPRDRVRDRHRALPRDAAGGACEGDPRRRRAARRRPQTTRPQTSDAEPESVEAQASPSREARARRSPRS